MITVTETKSRILELCADDAYGSWEFWPKADKTDATLEIILSALTELVGKGELAALHYTLKTGYQTALFDDSRLRQELERSRTGSVDPDAFYWFAAPSLAKSSPPAC